MCEQRDLKELNKKAREGVIKQFTDVSDSYEAPEVAEVVVDTASNSIEKSVKNILKALG